jgi:hypothetical protein
MKNEKRLKELEKEYAKTAKEMVESAEKYRAKLISIANEAHKLEVNNDTMDSNTGGIKPKTLSID